MCTRGGFMSMYRKIHTGGAPALRPGAIAQSPGREAALCLASLRKPAQLLAFAPGKEQAAGVWEP